MPFSKTTTTDFFLGPVTCLTRAKDLPYWSLVTSNKAGLQGQAEEHTNRKRSQIIPTCIRWDNILKTPQNIDQKTCRNNQPFQQSVRVQNQPTKSYRLFYTTSKYPEKIFMNKYSFIMASNTMKHYKRDQERPGKMENHLITIDWQN